MSLEWWRSAVFYQIYVRSFADSNGDGIGDLDGITAHLDYLNDGTNRSLGIDAIWLTPINPSPLKDGGYDVSDYCDVHPELGDLSAFERLIREAERHGIRIILDLVPNHTSDQHRWFRQSRSSRNNPKRDWYIWKPGTPGRTPTTGSAFLAARHGNGTRRPANGTSTCFSQDSPTSTTATPRSWPQCTT